MSHLPKHFSTPLCRFSRFHLSWSSSTCSLRSELIMDDMIDSLKKKVGMGFLLLINCIGNMSKFNEVRQAYIIMLFVLTCRLPHHSCCGCHTVCVYMWVLCASGWIERVARYFVPDSLYILTDVIGVLQHLCSGPPLSQRRLLAHSRRLWDLPLCKCSHWPWERFWQVTSNM